MTSEDRCVVCGAIVPEGRQVCSECERKTKKDKKYNAYVYKCGAVQGWTSGTYQDVSEWCDSMMHTKGCDEARILGAVE